MPCSTSLQFGRISFVRCILLSLQESARRSAGAGAVEAVFISFMGNALKLYFIISIPVFVHLLQQQWQEKAPCKKGSEIPGHLCEGAPPAGGGERTCGYPKYFLAMAGFSPPTLRGHLLAEGGKSYFFGFFSASGAFAVAAGTVAAAAVPAAAVLADEQDCHASSTKIITTMIMTATSYTTSYVSVGCFPARFTPGRTLFLHSVPAKHDPCNTALHQNDACCGGGTAQLTLDGSNRGATQGVYSKWVKIRKCRTMAVNGVNSVVSAAVSPPRRTVSVETTLSLAVKPVISAVETRQSCQSPAA